MFKKFFGKKHATYAQPKLELPKPTILRQPKILPTTCRRCRCQYLPSISNICLNSANRYIDCAPYVDCPVCGLSNVVKFDEPATSYETAGKVEAEHV